MTSRKDIHHKNKKTMLKAFLVSVLISFSIFRVPYTGGYLAIVASLDLLWILIYARCFFKIKKIDAGDYDYLLDE